MKYPVVSVGLGWLCVHSIVIAADLDSCPVVESEDGYGPAVVKVASGGLETVRILYDFDQDGWCDLWSSMFPELPRKDIYCDTDGDGLSDYVEMLWWRNPFIAVPPPRLLSPLEQAELEIRLEQEAAVRRLNAREADQETLRAFYAGLVGSQSRSIHPEEAMSITPLLSGDPPLVPNARTGEGSSSPRLYISHIERLSTGDVLLQWQGEADWVYSVEFSKDLENWQLGISNLPTISGVGE